jgi:PAS domain S-box-containing protein
MPVDEEVRPSAQVSAAEEARLLMAVFDACPFAIHAFDADLRVVLWNRATEELTGLTRAEVFGKSLPSDPELEAVHTRLRAGETLDGVEVPLTGRRGPWRVRLYAAPWSAQGALPGGVVAVAVEVTEQQRALDASARLASVVSASADAIVGLDPRGLIRAWNPAAEALFGHAAEDAIGHTMREIVDSVDPWRSDIDARLCAGEKITGFVQRIRRKGATVDLAWSFAGVRDSEGGCLGTSAIARDITVDLRREEGLARAADRARALAAVSGALAEASLDFRSTWEGIAYALAERIGDGCVVREVTRDGRALATIGVHHRDPVSFAHLVDSASAPLSVHGTLSGEVYRTGRPVLAPADDDAIQERSGGYFRSYVKATGAHSLIVVPIRSGGQIVGTLALLREKGSPLFDDDDLALVVDCARRAGDALERARLYDDAREARKVAERARANIAKLKIELETDVETRTAELHARLDDIEMMSYMMSHELRQAIRHVDANAALLVEEREEALAELGRDRISRIRATARRMTRLVETLLDVARLARASVRLESIALDPIVEEILEDLRRRDPARVIETVVHGGVAARADRTLLRVVLRHLLENAWKFTAPHATARIEVGVEHADGAPVYFVRDDGIGFDMTYADQLFRPLHQLNPPTVFEGSGIGLAIVRRAIERMGGRVWAEGTPDHGATFRFTLD